MRIRQQKGKRRETCKCGKKNDRLPQAYCTECHAAYMRQHRSKHHELTQEQKLKANARSYANVYLKRGKIERGVCEECGERAQMHHEDYLKPLQVRWFCRKHHLKIHN